MTLSSSRHDAVIHDTSVTVEHTTDETPRTWILSFNGEEVDRVSTDADCVLTGTLAKGHGEVRAVIRQIEDGTVRLDLVHDGESLVVFNDALEVG
ncbi:MAG TPA: hypothetical protein VFJ12_14185 [Segeticoccus sp.]|jgi:hypothetical protein|nr:hypothetical protein [Segeticoccus sp.]